MHIGIVSYFNLIFLSECCTIMNGVNQEIHIESNSSDAKVFINDRYTGQTPQGLILERKNKNKISLKLEGYTDFDFSVIRKVGSCNRLTPMLMIWSFFTDAIDRQNGSVFTLDPERINVKLIKAESAK
jgi:hypothetical protein